jgi:hypothetical protein
VSLIIWKEAHCDKGELRLLEHLTEELPALWAAVKFAKETEYQALEGPKSVIEAGLMEQETCLGNAVVLAEQEKFEALALSVKLVLSSTCGMSQTRIE